MYKDRGPIHVPLILIHRAQVKRDQWIDTPQIKAWYYPPILIRVYRRASSLEFTVKPVEQFHTKPFLKFGPKLDFHIFNEP